MRISLRYKAAMIVALSAHCMYNICMSTIAYLGNRIRIAIRSRDHAPAHVHVIVRAEGIEFRVYLLDLSVEYITDQALSSSDEKMILKFIEANREAIQEKWDEIQKDQ